MTRWIVGGTKDKPALEPDANITYNFVVQANKPFTRTQIVVNRVVLQGGRLADTTKDVTVQPAGK